MYEVPWRIRLLHFGGGLFYVAFFIAFYTLPAINLHSIHSRKDINVSMFFPLVVLILLFVRLFMRNYPSAFIGIFIARGKMPMYEKRTPTDRAAVSFFNFIAFLLPVTLISFDLVKEGFHQESYSPQLLWTCICLSILTICTTIVVFLKKEAGNAALRILGGVIFGSVFASVVWWAICESYVVYEMIFEHPELFRI